MAKKPSGKRSDVDEMVLPSALEAERAVLGAILLHNDAYDRASRHLTAASFFRDAHRRIWSAFQRLLDVPGGVVDLPLLKADLTKHGDLDEVGGPSYITALVDGVPRSSNVEHYALVVKDKSLLRDCIAVGNHLVTDAYIAEESATAIIARADQAIVALQHGARHDQMKPFDHSAYLDGMEYRNTHKGELTGVTTGFRSIDELTLGWQRGDMVVVAARPSVGKSTFVLNAAEAAAEAGGHVAIFSLEMKRRQIDDRRVAARTNIDLARIRSGYVRDEEYGRVSEAIGRMAELSFYVDDTASQSVNDIRATCRRLRSEHGLDLVVIDYIQLMPGTLDRRGATRNEEVTHISRTLKVLAGDLNVPMLVLSQLSRASEGRADPRPKLSDLRESGALEQDADTVMFLHRKHHRESGTTEAIFEKERNGSGGTVHLTLTRETCLFADGGEPLPPATEEEKQAAKTRAIIKSRSRSH